MKKLFYFLKRFGYNTLPTNYFKKKYLRLKAYEQNINPTLIQDRIDYYFKTQHSFPLPEQAVSIREFNRNGRTDYYLDLKEFLHFFNANTSFAYRFGDSTQDNKYPTLVKARTINSEEQNSILFKLNKHRHFQWIEDALPFSQKKPSAVWRGGAYLELRRNFVQKMWQHPSCDIGQTNKPIEDVPWQKNFLNKSTQLEHKFVFCIEGNDVATNLKWAMSSNSICLSPKLTKETWFMEGRLEAGKHYVELERDYTNLDEIIMYYSEHPKEAQYIIDNAHAHVEQFLDHDLEDLLCIKVLEKYADLSGQENAIKF